MRCYLNLYILISSVGAVSNDSDSRPGVVGEVGARPDRTKGDLAEELAIERDRSAAGLHDLSGYSLKELADVVAQLLGEVDWLTARMARCSDASAGPTPASERSAPQDGQVDARR